jgi:hypothetical protein
VYFGKKFFLKEGNILLSPSLPLKPFSISLYGIF